MRYTAATREYLNTMYFANTGAWSDGMVDAALAAFITAWNTNLEDRVGTDAQLARAGAVNLDVEFGYSPITTVGDIGTTVATMLSVNSAAYIKFTCAGSGAPREGGVFWPFVQEVNADGQGNLSGGALTLGTEFSNIATAVEAAVANTTHVVPSRFSKTAVPTPPHKRAVAVVNAVASYSVRPVVASQRDRRG